MAGAAGEDQRIVEQWRQGVTTPALIRLGSGFVTGCRCCGRTVRLQCETDYCGSRCRQGKCGHKD